MSANGNGNLLGVDKVKTPTNHQKIKKKTLRTRRNYENYIIVHLLVLFSETKLTPYLVPSLST